jgi:hypothetical protein
VVFDVLAFGKESKTTSLQIIDKVVKIFKVLILNKVIFDKMSNPHFCDIIYIIFQNHNAR